jgi:cell shape-determining protein MreC
MSGRSGVSLTLWFLLFAAVVAVNALVVHGAFGHWLAGIASPVSRWAVALIQTARSTGGDERVRELEDELTRLRSRAALDDAVVRERDLYRTAAGIRERLRREPTPAGIVAYPRAGGLFESVINRGARDWVAAGDIVVTGDGALVGVVREAWDDHASVVTLDDPSLQIAARVAGTAITGLVRADSEGGLVLDLVAKGELVTEGQVIETAGNDRFPAGLIIGTVRSVDATQATLFALVRVSPATQVGRSVEVLVMRPQ